MGGNGFKYLDDTPKRSCRSPPRANFPIGANLVFAPVQVIALVKMNNIWGMRGRGANTRFAPTVDDHDGMKMVRHENSGIQFHEGKPFRQSIPDFDNHGPRSIELHRVQANLPEEVFSILGANRDEIDSFLGIIPALQTDGASPFFSRFNHPHGQPYMSGL